MVVLNKNSCLKKLKGTPSAEEGRWWVSRELRIMTFTLVPYP
jgi:hypothetical protein